MQRNKPQAVRNGKVVGGCVVIAPLRMISKEKEKKLGIVYQNAPSLYAWCLRTFALVVSYVRFEALEISFAVVSYASLA